MYRDPPAPLSGIYPGPPDMLPMMYCGLALAVSGRSPVQARVLPSRGFGLSTRVKQLRLRTPIQEVPRGLRVHLQEPSLL